MIGRFADRFSKAHAAALLVTRERAGEHEGETRVQGLLEAVLGVMGVRESDVTDTDTLSNLGIDSMQLVEVS